MPALLQKFLKHFFPERSYLQICTIFSTTWSIVNPVVSIITASSAGFNGQTERSWSLLSRIQIQAPIPTFPDSDWKISHRWSTCWKPDI